MPTLLNKAGRRLFRLGDRFGVHVVPDHYYVPLASPRALRASKDRWNRPVDVGHLPMTLDGQRGFLRTQIAPFKAEYEGNRVYRQAAAKSAGPGYGFIEAQALHGFVRATKPRRIVEVGSGVSTFCMLEAARLNEAEDGIACAITCVEPYPHEPLRAEPVTLVAKKVEELDLELFDQLEAGDLLFIDSTHAFVRAATSRASTSRSSRGSSRAC